MSNKNGKGKKVKIKVVKVENPEVKIPIVKKYKEDVEEPDEEPVRERQGEFCTECERKTDTKKVGKEFLCSDCREELMENVQ